MSRAVAKKAPVQPPNADPAPLRKAAAPSPKPRSPRSRRRGASLADAAYEAIKRDIITCVLRPGEYINERQLCDRLRIGRTPVHQAIGHLAQENFVDVIPRKGIIVRAVSIDEYFNLDEARLVIEVEAMRLVAKRITQTELEALDAILARSHEARLVRNLEELLMIDRDFHFALAESTRNPVLIGMLKSAYERSLRIWFISLGDQNVDNSRDEHERLLAALRSRDGEAAAAIMREHILSSRAHTMRQA
jgi:DNA-binding GntR family transcriptional regulator